MNQTVTKDGKTVSICNYRYVDTEGRVETCHHVASCPVCGQCSRLDGDAEHGHCTGHLGLSEHIQVPGSDQTKARNEIDRKQREIKGQKRVGKQQRRGPRRERRQQAKG